MHIQYIFCLLLKLNPNSNSEETILALVLTYSQLSMCQECGKRAWSVTGGPSTCLVPVMCCSKPWRWSTTLLAFSNLSVADCWQSFLSQKGVPIILSRQRENFWQEGIRRGWNETWTRQGTSGTTQPSQPAPHPNLWNSHNPFMLRQ